MHYNGNINSQTSKQHQIVQQKALLSILFGNFFYIYIKRAI